MDVTNSELLPHILETLSRKPEFCDTYDNLYDEIAKNLDAENGNVEYGNLHKEMQIALNTGESLGIITLTDETIRVPFSFRTSDKHNQLSQRKQYTSNLKKSDHFVMKPRRRGRKKPNSSPHVPAKRRRSRSRSGRQRKRAVRRRRSISRSKQR